jgi:hypothetical protein
MSDHDHDDNVEAYEPPAVIDRVRIEAVLITFGSALGPG